MYNDKEQHIEALSSEYIIYLCIANDLQSFGIFLNNMLVTIMFKLMLT